MIVQDLNFDQTVAMAKAKAESMIQNGLYSRFGLSEKERLDKALLGCIGELAFQKHLKNLGTHSNWTRQISNPITPMNLM